MKKKTILLLITIIITLTLTGCFTKTPIDEKTFTKTLEEENYTVQDITDQFTDYDGIKSVTVAVSPKSTFQIEFYKFKTKEDAAAVYSENQKAFEEEKTNSSIELETNGKNYSRYSLTANGKYMIASRIEKTFIYVNAEKEYSDEIKEILEKIKY